MSVRCNVVFYVTSFLLGVGFSILIPTYILPQLERIVHFHAFVRLVKDWLFGPTSSHNGSSPLALLTLVDMGAHKNQFSVSVLPASNVQQPDSNRAIQHPYASNLELDGILKKAIEFHENGKHAKSMKLLRQCKSMSPKNPDVLNYYGEGVEKHDVIDADHHYALALVLQPDHSRARVNRKRSSPLVKERDLYMLQRIDGKREKLMTIPEGNAALHRAKTEAYYQHIYHTNAIEGNTMTLSMTRSIVESGMAIGGKSILEHNEVLGMDAALKYVNATINKFGPTTVEDILEVHKRVLGYTQPLDAGVYRRSQVFVGDHKPPHAMKVEELMLAFDRWLRSDDVALLHPIELAALAHYKLVYIHPFIDGNGRTSRLLMNIILMKAGYPPVIIRKEQRHEYYEQLQNGNLGDVRPFIRFIARCTENDLNSYLDSVTIHRRVDTVKGERLDVETIQLGGRTDEYDPFYNNEALTRGGGSSVEDEDMDAASEDINKQTTNNNNKCSQASSDLPTSSTPSHAVSVCPSAFEQQVTIKAANDDKSTLTVPSSSSHHEHRSAIQASSAYSERTIKASDTDMVFSPIRATKSSTPEESTYADRTVPASGVDKTASVSAPDGSRLKGDPGYMDDTLDELDLRGPGKSPSIHNGGHLKGQAA